ncbi:DUF4352 domain-containing protein [Caldifermentibacillus hisashii]|uniref:DUF4352 domain-containing protein n=1 Tax=Caldifermentibacillus hisashii TaxID=996558 RepID=UPI003D1AE68F
MKKIGKFILWVVGIFIILGVIGALMGDDGDSTKGNNSTTASSKVDSEVKNTDQKEEKKVQAIGEKVEVGKLAYTVSNVETTNELKSDNEYIEPATTDGQFVVIDIEAFNNDKETRMVDSSMFKIKDNQGREFEPTTDTDVMMVLGDFADFFLQDINPGISKTGKLVFELPSDANNFSLEVSSGFGFAGGDYETIQLK